MYAREPVPSGDSYERDARVGVSIGPRMKPHIGRRLGKLCRMLHYFREAKLKTTRLKASPKCDFSLCSHT